MLYFLLFCLSFSSIASDDFFEDDTTEFVEIKKNDDFYDPLEKVNRGTFWVSSFITKFTLLPIAKAYKNTVPQKIQPNVGSFANNFNILTNLPYTALIPQKPILIQGSSKFLTNTLFGFFGFFDIHSHYVEDGLLTLGVDGVAQYYYNKKLPYLYFPWGPGNVFGIADFPSQVYFRKALPQGLWGLTFLGIVSQISSNYDIIYDGLYNSVDPYSITRNVYYSLQKRNLENIRQRKYQHTPYKKLLPAEFL